MAAGGDLRREDMTAALRRVVANKGAAGVDGMPVLPSPRQAQMRREGEGDGQAQAELAGCGRAMRNNGFRATGSRAAT